MSYEPYTSDELTHFVGRRCPTDDERCYNLLLKILQEGRLKAGGIPGAGGEAASGPMLSITGPGKISDATAIRGQIVCFCDIPLSGLGLHVKKYGCFGVAFRKPFLVTRGANPVFYVVKDSMLPGNQVLPTGSGSLEVSRDITRAEIMDRIMEREWRVYGDVLFAVRDVARIILPDAYTDRFRGELPDYSGPLFEVRLPLATAAHIRDN
jgi:hypothetical protein